MTNDQFAELKALILQTSGQNRKLPRRSDELLCRMYEDSARVNRRNRGDSLEPRSG